jgi:hypothetical protein
MIDTPFSKMEHPFGREWMRQRVKRGIRAVGAEYPTGKKKHLRELAGIGGLRRKCRIAAWCRLASDVSAGCERQAASVEHGTKDEASNNPQ